MPDMARKPSAQTRKEGGAGESPKRGVTIRMYRIGHGDCFLLSFDGKKKTVFVLIDCGYKPGSPKFIKTLPDEIVADIRNLTGGNIDVAIITHEHQDHVNGITQARFKDITIGQTWFAWTESDSDPLAKRLRKKRGDTLKALATARTRLAVADPAVATRLDAYMSLEIGGEGNVVPGDMALAAAAGSWTNKDSMKLLRDRSTAEVRCIYPHKEIIVLPGTDVRVFALGPPYDEYAISDLNPRGDESFPTQTDAEKPAPSLPLALAPASNDITRRQPFSPRHSVAIDALATQADLQSWYKKVYGPGDDAISDSDEILPNAEFRRIEADWLLSAEQLALALGNDTNNSSLVLAFELGKGGKVLLFAGDAQRGNWVSWAAQTFPDGEQRVEVRELLGRTVLYKVGHHGSHNATLTGKASSSVANLTWLGRGRYADEFTAMITAVRAWATQPTIGWDHPLISIKNALIEKCSGRVFQTDTEMESMTRGCSDRAWSAFLSRSSGNRLYFDYRIESD